MTLAKTSKLAYGTGRGGREKAFAALDGLWELRPPISCKMWEQVPHTQLT